MLLKLPINILNSSSTQIQCNSLLKCTKHIPKHNYSNSDEVDFNYYLLLWDSNQSSEFIKIESFFVNANQWPKCITFCHFYLGHINLYLLCFIFDFSYIFFRSNICQLSANLSIMKNQGKKVKTKQLLWIFVPILSSNVY